MKRAPDRVAAYLAEADSLAEDAAAPSRNKTGYVLAKGNFDKARIEGFIQSKGGTPQEYRGKSLWMAPEHAPAADPDAEANPDADAAEAPTEKALAARHTASSKASVLYDFLVITGDFMGRFSFKIA